MCINVLLKIYLSLIFLIISFTVISRLRKTVKQVNKNETTDNTEEITNKVAELKLNIEGLANRH